MSQACSTTAAPTTAIAARRGSAVAVVARTATNTTYIASQPNRPLKRNTERIDGVHAPTSRTTPRRP